MAAKLHIVKLSVGSESIAAMSDWQARRSQQRRDGRYYHLTRMWPRRADELLAGGSIYWVIQGVILARQRITALEEMTGDDGIRRCAVFLDPDIVRTRPIPRRPFQGWRYLLPEDAPDDLASSDDRTADLPPKLLAALSDIGVR